MNRIPPTMAVVIIGILVSMSLPLTILDTSSSTLMMEPGSEDLSMEVHETRSVPSMDLMEGMIHFTENLGQLEDDDVRFYSEGGNLVVSFKDYGISYTIFSHSEYFVYEISFLGFEETTPRGELEKGTDNNYLRGNDERAWITGVDTYQQIRYKGIYQGIDLVFYIKDGKLKYDLILEPGARHDEIGFRYIGIEPQLQGGRIRLDTPLGTIWEDIPVSWQDDGSPIDVHYRILGTDTLSYHVEGWDPTKVLTIDPGVSLSTYIGGGQRDSGYDVTHDDEGNLYITGETQSTNFPTSAGSYDTTSNGGGDVFVTKINTSVPEVEFSTYIGGSAEDISYAIDLDTSGNIVIGGRTASGDYPTRNAYDSQKNWQNPDAFLTKLDSDGDSLVFSTFIGGWPTDAIYDITLDSSNNIYVTGETGPGWNQWQNRFKYPTTSGAYTRNYVGGIETFATKFNSQGSNLVYSTYLPGSNNDYGLGIAVDGSGNAYITGLTQSSNYPTTSGAFDRTYNNGGDAFVTKVLSSGGGLSYSTFLGGSSDDRGHAIVVDSSGQAIITGESESSGGNSYPTTTQAYDITNGGGDDVILTQLSSSGGSLQNSTYIGVGGADSGSDLYLEDGIVHLSGYTTSSSFPTTGDGFDRTYNGGGDAFIMKMDLGGEGLIYSTFMGGSGLDEAEGISVDQNGHIYIAGRTTSTDLPISINSIDRTANGNGDAFAAKFYPAYFGPSNLTADAGYFTVELNWDPPEEYEVDGYPLQSYRIYRGLSASSMELIADVGNVTTFNETINYFISRDYYYFVTAIFDVIGESKETNTVVATPMVTPPPGDPSATVGDLFINVSWGMLDQTYFDMFDIDYILYRGLSSEHLTQYARVGENGYFNDTAIPPIPREYFYMVSYEVLGVGESNLSAVINATPNTPPSQPYFDGIQELDRGFRINWTEPLHDGGYEITSYRLNRGPSESVLTEIGVFDSDTLGFMDQGLEPGTMKYYSIQAVNPLGGSITSIAGPYLVKTVPSAPTDIMTIGTRGQIEVHWNEPEYTWSEPLTSYNIYSVDGDEEPELIGNVGPSKHIFKEFSDNGVVMNFSISAVNRFGEGDLSGPVEGMALGVPQKVNMKNGVPGDSSARISWEPVTDDGGSPVMRYTVYRSTEMLTPFPIANLSSQADSYQEDGLDNGVSYYYWISAWNLIGESELSVPLVVIPGTLPPAPFGLTAHPDLERIVLNWEVPSELGGKPGIEARIWKGSTPGSVRPYDVVSIATTRYEDVPIAGGETCYYMVSLINTEGEGPGSQMVQATAYGYPGAPEFTEIQVSRNMVTLNWSEPDLNGGSDIISYRLNYRREGEQQWEFIDVDELTYSFTNLIPGRKYSFMVTAETLRAVGDGSEIVDVIVGEVPEPPLDPEATPGPGRVTLKWKIRSGIQPPASGFTVYIGAGDGPLVKHAEVESTAGSLRIDGLLNGNEYRFAITCSNILGEGGPTEIVAATPKGIPSAVETIWVEESGDGFVKVKWDPPAFDKGSQIRSYDVVRTRPGGVEEQVFDDITEMEFIDETVENGKIYVYMARAINSIGAGPDGTMVESTPMAKPLPPRNLKAEPGTDTIRITWSPPSSTGGFRLDGYLLWRSEDGGEPVLIADMDPETNTYLDEDVKSGKYSYSIRAYTSKATSNEEIAEVEVPSRTATMLIFGLVGAIVPLIIFLLVIFLPGYLKRRKDRQEEKKKKEEEEEKRLRQERAENLLNQPKRAPALSTSMASMTGPRPDLPPVRTEIPPEKEKVEGDGGYIRPADRKKDSKKDKKTILRADGKSLEHREQEEERRHSLSSKTYEGSHEWEHEKNKVLKKESEEVFTGQQKDKHAEEKMKAPPPVSAPVGSEPPAPPEMVDQQAPVVEDIPDWGEDEIPLSDPPQEETGKDDFQCETGEDDDVDCIEEIDEVEELEELEEL